MHVEHLRVPVGAGALHVERIGRGGPAVVLLHGFGTCTFLWRRLAPALAELGFTSLSIDLLGHGESDRPDDADYALMAQAEHVSRALSALRIPSATLIGQGIGGLVGLLLAADPRVLIENVALLSPPDPDDLPGPEIRTLQRQSALVALSANTLFGVRPALAPLLRSGVANPENMSDLLVARYMAPFVGPDGLAQLLQRASAIELVQPARRQLSERTTRTLVLYGERDADRPQIDWSTLLPKAALHSTLVPKSGRLIPEDAPTALLTILDDWLKTRAPL